MQLIKGVGNREILAWTVFSIASCFIVAFPLSYFFQLHDVDWRVIGGGSYADMEKAIESQNNHLRIEFDNLHRAVAADPGKPVRLPYFTPEVHCPHLVPVGGRKLCAPWQFNQPIPLNRVDMERWRHSKQRVVIHKRGQTVKGGIEGSEAVCRSSVIHSGGETPEDADWKRTMPKCDHRQETGVALTPEHISVMYVAAEKDMGSISPSAVRGAHVCQLVLDLVANAAQTVRDLREFGLAGYRIMSYERIDAPQPTARFSFIQSNCTDHFGAKYIMKYLA